MQPGVGTLLLPILLHFYVGNAWTPNRIQCNQTIPHGLVADICPDLNGKYCYYTCDEGYTASDVVTAVRCGTSWESAQKWIPDFSEDMLCSPKSCNRTILNGNFSHSCQHKVGFMCNYTCQNGYTPSPFALEVDCLPTTYWNVDPGSLCLRKEAVQCRENITNGFILPCGAGVDQECPFNCSYGYRKHGNVSTVTCSPDGLWIPQLYNTTEKLTVGDICIDIRCKGKIPNGYILEPCDNTEGHDCTFNCSEGYKKVQNVSEVLCTSSRTWKLKLHEGKLNTDVDHICIDPSLTAVKISSINVGLYIGIGIVAVFTVSGIILLLCLRQRSERKGRRHTYQVRTIYRRTVCADFPVSHATREEDHCLIATSTTNQNQSKCVQNGVEPTPAPVLPCPNCARAPVVHHPPPYTEAGKNCSQNHSPPSYEEVPGKSQSAKLVNDS